MNVRQATSSYERWMRRCAPIVEGDLRDKHAKMKQDPFQFLRGSYYRWAQLWPVISKDFTSGPVVSAVGDLHVDSYGTWRDAEGRLCWGVDDFDESWPLPYTNDLIRLATSAKVARKMGLLDVKTKLASEIILGAYEDTLVKGGCPVVLAEEERHLEKLGIEALKAPKCFWEKLTGRPALRSRLPSGIREAIERTLPDPSLRYKVVQREAGLGSLGQQRFVAIAECLGGCIAREAKRVVPSASMWVNGRTAHCQSYYSKTITGAVRSPDPYQTITGSWLVRRLSPDSNPIKIEELPKKRDEEVLLNAMGSEIANVHLGSKRQARPILRDLARRKSGWLRSAAGLMGKAMLQEWKDYRS